MKIKRIECIPMITLSIGIILMVLSVILPPELLQNILGANKIGGLFTIIICPVIGLIGLVIAVLKKKVLLAIGNLAVIFAFPIMMLVVQLVNML